MFGISFSEILLILFISLIVFGPKQLPQIAKLAGNLIFSLRQFFTRLKFEIYQQSGFNQLKQTELDLVNIYQQIKQDILSTRSTNVNPVSHGEYIASGIPDCLDYPQLYQAEFDFDRQPELFDE